MCERACVCVCVCRARASPTTLPAKNSAEQFQFCQMMVFYGSMGSGIVLAVHIGAALGLLAKSSMSSLRERSRGMKRVDTDGPSTIAYFYFEVELTSILFVVFWSLCWRYQLLLLCNFGPEKCGAVTEEWNWLNSMWGAGNDWLHCTWVQSSWKDDYCKNNSFRKLFRSKAAKRESL